ncbi:MAG: L-threonine 3-dehydrogenase [Legionellales bacterium]|nr:L-threonine 3-dehydrogenase [Legionellales bacterium]|tara:strand:- start:61316 stop:62338 length:1023 start_codon:yes stop_codon:yes gene_type:complete
MKALSKLKPEPGIWMTDVPEPKCGPNDLLIKINKTAICGTDVHIYNWDEWAQQAIPTPMIIGHEFAGEVVEVGSEVKGYKVGDRVSGEGHLTCGHCRNCRAGKCHLCRNTISVGCQRPGCFAEYLSLPASNAFKIPDGISDDEAAILDPFGNATHCALSFDMVGEDVLITGAGPVGLMAIPIAQFVGARNVVITDLNEERLALARQLGATRAVNIQETRIRDVMKELDIVEGFDVALEMSGSPHALDTILRNINNGGNVVLLGLLPESAGINWTNVIFKGVTLKGIFGREMYETWYKMATMLKSGVDIKPVITDHFAVDDYQQAFDRMRSGNSGKVIMEW